MKRNGPVPVYCDTGPTRKLFAFLKICLDIVFQEEFFHILDKNKIHLKKNSLNSLDFFLTKHFHDIFFKHEILGETKNHSYFTFAVITQYWNDSYH